MSGLGVKTDYINNNTVENVFEIITAQIDTTPDLIKENDKFLIELLKIFWEVEETDIHAEQDAFIKGFENSAEHNDSQYTPWKGEFKSMPDNFVPTWNRLFF